MKKLRAERDGSAVEKSLKQLRETASGQGSLMEPIIECVENYTTIGEICSTLVEIFGEASETNP